MEELPVYTRDDYLTTTKPFEYLYAHKENKFEMRQLMGRMSIQAQAVGVRNLATLFKDYIETVSGTVTPGFNRTDFTGQEMELDCGGWTATDTGIYGTDKMGFEVVACYHPIMPVQRLVNVDTREHKVMLAYRLSRRWDIVIVDRNVISDSRSIIGLSKYGIMVNSETGKALVRYMADVEQLNYDLIPERYPAWGGWAGLRNMASRHMRKNWSLMERKPTALVLRASRSMGAGRPGWTARELSGQAKLPVT